MKAASTVLLSLPALSAAYPGMMGVTSRADIEAQLKAAFRREAVEKREAKPQLLNPIGNLLGSFGDVVSGLLNPVGQAIVVADNKRSEPGYTFQVGTGNLNVQTLLCDIYQGINFITPLVLGGTLEQTSKTVTWALSVLDPIFSKTALGYPDSVVSPDLLYLNSSQQGGPENPPPASDSKTGDNVYDRVYYSSASQEPACWMYMEIVGPYNDMSIQYFSILLFRLRSFHRVYHFEKAQLIF